MDDLISRQQAIDAVSNCGICIQRIVDLPSVQPDTTTHDSIPAENGRNDGDGTSGDCISRQQAIDALRKMQTYKLFAGDDMILVDKAQVQTELMMLPPAQPEQPWISVTEKLPEESGDYLVTRYAGYAPDLIIIDIARYEPGEWHKAYPVTAWMPLPERYQGESEDKE